MGRGNYSTKARHWEQIDEEKRYKIKGLLEAGQRKGKIAKLLGMSERTIRREIAIGSVIQRDCELRDRLVYKADYAQRVHAERASNKGRGFKIGHDHALCRYLEQKIGVEKYSPDAAIREIRRGKYRFTETLCTKTVYNMIDRGFFLSLTNVDLPVKRAGKKRGYRFVRRALNHKGGKSITERPKEVDSRRQTGHWEMDLVVDPTKECLLVMSERASRLELIRRLPGKEQVFVKAALDGIERETSHFSFGQRSPHKPNYPANTLSLTLSDANAPFPCG